MDAIVKFLEKHQALFDKISKNIYLVAIKDGFLSNMPIVLFSSLFLLLSTLPAYVGITLPSEVLDFFNKIYAYTKLANGTASSVRLARSITAHARIENPNAKISRKLCAIAPGTSLGSLIVTLWLMHTL